MAIKMAFRTDLPRFLVTTKPNRGKNFPGRGSTFETTQYRSVPSGGLILEVTVYALQMVWRAADRAFEQRRDLAVQHYVGSQPVENDSPRPQVSNIRTK